MSRAFPVSLHGRISKSTNGWTAILLAAAGTTARRSRATSGKVTACGSLQGERQCHVNRSRNATVLFVATGDTSSDEVTGHMYALPLAHDLLAATDTQRAQIVQIVNQTVAYIVRRGLVLLEQLENRQLVPVWLTNAIRSAGDLA